MVSRGVLLTACFLILPASPVVAANCERDSTGLIPLTDLGPGGYGGFQGGLYPGGVNQRPPAHRAAGVSVASQIVPLDTLGSPDPGGRIVLISIGMSNATQEFSTFVPKAMGDPLKRPEVLVVDCAQGGQATQDIGRPTAPYWDFVASRLRANGSAPLQAQVVWIKEARRRPDDGFPAEADSLMRELGTIVRIIKDEMPNLRLAYFTSRIYAGYATTALNPEPYAYESGFAVKWLIEAQMNGVDSLNWDPAQGSVEAPWITWGPYLWADGLEPRSDGMVWPCAAFQDDGTHPSSLGRSMVADSLLAFFKRDETATPWFVKGTVGVPEVPAAAGFSVAPNPARRQVEVRFRGLSGAPWRVEALDVSGRRVRELGRGAGGGEVSLSWDLRDAAGVRVASGLYWLRVSSGPWRGARRVLVLEPS